MNHKMRQFLLLILIILTVWCHRFTPDIPTPNLLPGKATHRIDKIDPNPEGARYPGNRGPDELVLYTPKYGQRTGTNIWGAEAIVEQNVVVSLNRNNSLIPRDGFVISGHGKSARWIEGTIKPGAYVRIEDNELIITYPVSALIFIANRYIQEAESRLSEADKNKISISEINSCLRSARHLIKKAEKTKDKEQARNYALKGVLMAKKANAMFKESKTPELRGAWVRLEQKNLQQIRELVRKIKQANFNVIFPETIFEGYTLYPSPEGMIPQHPMYKDWDPLKVFIEEAHKEGIQVHAWCHIFFVGFDSPLIKEHKDWLARDRDGSATSRLEAGYHFFCPANPEARRFLQENFKWLVANYELDGFQFDYIRYPRSEPGNQEFCFCDNCRQQFYDRYKKELRELTPESDPGLWEEWSEKRRQDITKFIAETAGALREIKPGLIISADIFPEPEEALNRVYQPWLNWAERREIVDLFCPMVYSSFTSEVEKTTKRLVDLVPPDTSLAIGLGYFIYKDVDKLAEQIETVRKHNVAGEVIFALNQMQDADYELLGAGVYRTPSPPLVK